MKERTFVMLKPDGVQRNLIGEIIKKFENAGLKIVAMKMVQADEKLVEKHYPPSMAVAIAKKTKASFDKEGKEFPWGLEEYGMMIVRYLRKYITEGPVVPIILEGEDTIEKVKNLVGHTDPTRAKKGSIRGDLGKDSYEKANAEKRAVRNLIHLADRERIEEEIDIWFKKEEIYS